jgi:branched-chain amino acid transport system ATP-binding protein
MSRKRYTPEQIIGKLREAEVALAQGETVGQVCRTLGIAEQTYYRWRREYGGLKVEQAEILRKVQISINEGELVSLVGLNGAGKSSLLKAILGLVDYEGEVRWQGVTTKNLTTAQIVRLGIAFAPETRELFRYLTVKENLELGGDRLKPAALKERLAYIYELFPILKERLA